MWLLYDRDDEEGKQGLGMRNPEPHQGLDGVWPRGYRDEHTHRVNLLYLIGSQGGDRGTNTPEASEVT